MTSREWDAVETRFCQTCVYDKHGRAACPIKSNMHKNPNDAMASQMVCDGRCTQYSRKM